MTPGSRAMRAWSVFAVGAVLVCAALAWITSLGLRIERAEQDARAANRQEEAARLALWRMDSAFSAELLRASVWLSARSGGSSPLFRCGFELGVEGARVVADGDASSDDAFVRRLSRDELARRVAAGERLLPASPGSGANGHAGEAAVDVVGNANLEEFLRRQVQLQNVQGAQLPPSDPPALPTTMSLPVGPLVPFWSDGAGTPELLFVQRDRGDALRGLRADWPAVRTFLLAQVEDLLPGASLRRAGDVVAPEEWRLASMPVVLEAPPSAAPMATGWTPLRLSLLFVWLASIAALLATAFVLRAAIALGERRGRFVAAVTHELRTPLTTFRLYTQMLAGGMVADATARQDYLATLHAESERLARLVDGVLQFAQLENRGVPRPAEPIGLAAALDALVPRLEARAREAGMALAFEPGDLRLVAVRAEPWALEQILFNLVDNACKYAAAAEDRRVHLRAVRRGRRVAIEVEDHGPGIAPRDAAALFEPFRRGSAEATSSLPGVGLGLALARGMARGLGGDLRASGRGQGARFVLDLPLA